MTNKLKEKLARGEVVLGTFITLNCPELLHHRYRTRTRKPRIHSEYAQGS